MPNRSCPHCARRLPYAGRRCIHCGWTVAVRTFTPGAGVTWWRRPHFWSVAIVSLGLAVAQFAYQNSTALADWYASFAARFLPEDASSLAPSDTETGAFFFCARQVAKKMEDRFSVETFDGLATRTVSLGERRYRVESMVDEARQSGEQVRHDFSCTVRYERGRWVLEDLRVERYAGGELPTLLARQTAR